MRLRQIAPIALGLLLLGGTLQAYAQTEIPSDSDASASIGAEQSLDLLNAIVDYTINHDTDRELQKADYKKIVDMVKGGADLDQSARLPATLFGGGYGELDQIAEGQVEVTPIILAIRADSTELVSFLLAKGATVDDRTIRFAFGKNNLRPASWNKLVVTYVNQQFLGSGKNLNGVIEDGKTPLMLVTEIGIIDAIELLIAKGANPNAKGVGGITPLMLAAENANANAEITLLNKGANPLLKNDKGETAIEIAEENNANNANGRALEYMRQIVRKSGKK